MKNCALILSGFLRKEENLKEIKKYVENNKDFNLNIFINSYDLMGFPEKAHTTNVQASEKVNENTFAGLNPSSLIISPYNEVMSFLKDFVSRGQASNGGWPPKRLAIVAQGYMLYKNLLEDNYQN